MLTQCRFAKGDVLMRENDFGETAYIIERGRVAISKRMGDKEIALATLGPGDTVGEMSMIDDKPRSATATAIEDVVAREIHQDDLYEHLQTDPEVTVALLKALFERLREADARFLQLSGSAAQGSAAPARHAQPVVVLEGLTPEASGALPSKTVRIESFPFRVGRHSHNPLVHNDLSLNDELPWQISRHHAAFVLKDGRVGVMDRGSQLGGEVDGTRFGGNADDPGPLYFSGGEGTLVLGGKQSPYSFRVTIEGA